jgi:predicted phosphodiesterase/predicted NACHT family NTPase
MPVTWLHVSDFHFSGGDRYDRDVVLRALLRSVKSFRERGRQPDVVFATGDVAHAGQANEYEAATAFFDALLAAAGLERTRLFVVPGNHDVDRKMGIGLARTFESREAADQYFNPEIPKRHITQKQRAFLRWYNRYFDGIRHFPEDSSCGPVEVVDIRGFRIGVLPLNSALFSQGDDDHGKLWIGRRCLDPALEELEKIRTDIRIALVHHPLDWLNDMEGSNIRAELQSGVDFILRGHLHRIDVERIAGISGEALHLAAGAAYQSREYPNRAIYATIDGDRINVFPIRFEDEPREIWTVDPSFYPQEPAYEKSLPIQRLIPRTFEGHTDAIHGVAVLADGRRALSASRDKTLRLWDLDAGKELRRLQGHSDEVLSEAMLASGRRAVSGSGDHTMRLWDLEAGKELRRFEHPRTVQSVAALPDGRKALSGCRDGKVRLWDLEAGKELRRFDRNTDWIYAVAALPDGRRALSGSGDHFMRLWDLETGDELRHFSHPRSVLSVAVLPDGGKALSGCRDGKVRLWDLGTGAELSRFEGHAESVWSLAVLADGRRALSGSQDTTIRLWNLETGAQLRLLKGHSGDVFSVAIAPDGRRALSGSEDRKMLLWNI